MSDSARPTSYEELVRRREELRREIGTNLAKMPEQERTNFLERASRPPARERRGEMAALAEGALQGISFNFADEIEAGLRSFLGGDPYEVEHKRANKRLDEYAEDQPLAFHGGNIGAGVASGLLMPASIAPRLLGRVAGTALGGAAYGAASGAGLGSGEERLGNAGLGAVVGGGVGAVAGKLSGALAGRADGLEKLRLEDEAASAPSGAVRAGFDEFGVSPDLAQSTGHGPTWADRNAAIQGGLGPAAMELGGNKVQQQAGEVRSAVNSVTGELAGQHAPIGTGTVAGETLKRSMDDLASGERHLLNSGEEAVNRYRDKVSSIIGGDTPVANEVDAGQRVGEAVRAGAARSKKGYDDAYEDVFSRDGEFDASLVERLDPSIREGLRDSPGRPIFIDELTPIAANALSKLKEVSTFRAPNDLLRPLGKDDVVTGLSLAGVDRARKFLLDRKASAYAAGRAPGGRWDDYRAMDAIVDQFDSQLMKGIDDGLFNGDQNLLGELKNARGLYAEYRRTYFPDGDIKDAMKRIVEGRASPEKIASYLDMTRQLPGGGISAQLAMHLRDILPDDAFGAIRQAHWRLLTKPAKGERITQANAMQISDRINEVTTGKGRTLANVLYGRDEIQDIGSFGLNLRKLASHPDTRAEALQAMIDIANDKLNPAQLVAMAVGGSSKSVGKSNQNWRLVNGVIDVFGRESREFSEVRQAYFLRSIGDPAPGNPLPGYAVMAKGIRESIDGTGAPIARIAYTPEQAAKLRRLADMLEHMVTPPGAFNASGSANHARRMMFGVISNMLSALGRFVPGGGMAGEAVGYGVGAAGRALDNRAGTAKAQAIFNNVPTPTDPRGPLAERALRGAGEKTQRSALPAISAFDDLRDMAED